MGKGPGPSALEQLFVVNALETLTPPARSTLTRFNIKTHTATTPIERSYLSNQIIVAVGVAVYKGKVYVVNSGLDDQSYSAVDVFNANTLELEQTWKTSQFGPIDVAAYKDNIYVTCLYATEDADGAYGNAVDVFPIDRQENKDGPSKSWQTSQFAPTAVAAYEDNIYVTCANATEERAEGAEVGGNAVDVFSVDADNNASPGKTWQTSQFRPFGVAAYEDNIYVTCANATGKGDFGGNAVDVFSVDADNNASPGKSWQTSQFAPFAVAAYEDNIYVTCANATEDFTEEGAEVGGNAVEEGAEVGGNAVDVFSVDADNNASPGKTWQTSQFRPFGVAAYEDNIYVTCGRATEEGEVPGNAVDIFPVDAKTGAGPSEIWTTDYAPSAIAAYNSQHPEGNLYIDASGSNVV